MLKLDEKMVEVLEIRAKISRLTLEIKELNNKSQTLMEQGLLKDGKTDFNKCIEYERQIFRNKVAVMKGLARVQEIENSYVEIEKDNEEQFWRLK